MQYLASKNYDRYDVFVMDVEKPISLNAAKGRALMDYLQHKDAGQFVELTDSDGTTILIRTTTIRRIVPHEAAPALDSKHVKELLEKL